MYDILYYILFNNFFFFFVAIIGNAAGQWLGIRLQLLGVLIVACVTAIAIIERATGNSSNSSLSPGLVGLSISYALTVTSLLSGVVSSFTDTEKEIISVERAYQYIDHVPLEDKEHIEFSARAENVRDLFDSIYFILFLSFNII